VEGIADDVVLSLFLGLVALALDQTHQGDFLFQPIDFMLNIRAIGKFLKKPYRV
jgi:hypothetical protein